MRHGGRLWRGPTLTSLSHSMHRYALTETRFGIGSDRSNRNAWSAPTSPMGRPFPLSFVSPERSVFPPVCSRNHLALDLNANIRSH
jgi:hypothetical protein